MTCDALYHYCTIDAFLSIIKNKTLRLSDVKKSNDSLESKALLQFVEDNVMEIFLNEYSHIKDYTLISGMDNTDAIKLMVSARLKHILENDDILCYASCLSEENDLLSQWRAYADNGKGLSIGFSYPVLKELVDSSDFLKLEEVKYVTEENAPSLLLGTASMERFLDDMFYESMKEKAAEEVCNNA